jgi:hypothetical protein
MMRIRPVLVFAGVVALVAALGAVDLPPANAAPAAPPSLAQSIWGGWSAHAAGGKGRMYAQWTVPEVKCNALGQPPQSWNRSRAAAWVGLWGKDVNNPATWLPQIGTVSRCLGGLGGYYAVVEMAHKSGGPGTDPMPVFNVRPGDQIISTLFYDGPRADRRLQFSFSITDPDATKRGEPSNSSGIMLTDPGDQEQNALWSGGCIVENDQPELVQGGLAQFPKPISFSQCKLNGYGVARSGDRARWDMVRDPTGRPLVYLADVGASNNKSGAFSVTWKTWR